MLIREFTIIQRSSLLRQYSCDHQWYVYWTFSFRSLSVEYNETSSVL